ncbi:MAG: hypothetical protein IKR17_04520 [Bacteroidales bacterium]|nr:hypothetical protein [Bacteroidales bacterium]
MRFQSVSKIIYLSIAVLFTNSACQEQYNNVPDEAVVEYDVLYSNDIKESFGPVGEFLPSKATVNFNEYGIRVEAQGILSMYTIGLICTTKDAFGLFDYSDYQLVLPLQSLASMFGGVGFSDSITIVRENTKYINVCGMEATDIEMVSRSPIGDVNISAFYVPTRDNGNRLSIGNIKIPGLPTSINLNKGESNVVIRLKSIHAEKVDNKLFNRPIGFRETSIDEFDGIAAKLGLKPKEAGSIHDYIPSQNK